MAQANKWSGRKVYAKRMFAPSYGFQSYFHIEIQRILKLRQEYVRYLYELLLEQIPDGNKEFDDPDIQSNYDNYFEGQIEYIAPQVELLLIDFITGWCVMIDEILHRICKDLTPEIYDKMKKRNWKWTDSICCIKQLGTGSVEYV